MYSVIWYTHHVVVIESVSGSNITVITGGLGLGIAQGHLGDEAQRYSGVGQRRHLLGAPVLVVDEIVLFILNVRIVIRVVLCLRTRIQFEDVIASSDPGALYATLKLVQPCNDIPIVLVRGRCCHAVRSNREGGSHIWVVKLWHRGSDKRR